MALAPVNSTPSHGPGLRLLSLDGGGVRGLSSLLILQKLMENIDHKHPPKPCDYFDMIGGTSTGGLIAIMLGRLRMTVQECIDEYLELCPKIFTKTKKRLSMQGTIQGKFDHIALEVGVRSILRKRGIDENALLKDDSAESDNNCKT